MQIIITSPSLDTKNNVSGISSVTKFITNANCDADYIHFELGKRDNEKRSYSWFFRVLKVYFSWPIMLLGKRNARVHFNLAVDKLGVLRDTPLLIFAKMLKRKMVIHLHGGEYLSHKVPPKWMTRLLRLTFSGKNPVIVLSSNEALILKNRFNCKNVFVLPNCIDLSIAEKYQREHHFGKLKILFIGRISKAKGLELIYSALKNLKEEGVKFEFSLAGKGPDEQEFIEKFTTSLGEAFKFHGVVDGKQKVELLKNSSVFLLPSFFEGLPISLLECMSFGLIPVATPVGSIPEIVKHEENGYILKLKSIESIETAIKQLVNDYQQRSSMSRNARQFIFKNFDPHQYISTLSKIYCYE